MSPFVYKYKTRIKWKEKKKAVLSSSGKPDIEVATPLEFKGHPGIWSPEDLLVASVNTCVMTTFLYFAEKASLNFSSYESEAEGEVVLEKGDLTFSSISVRPHIIIGNEADREKAQQAMENTEKYCLISSSLKLKVTLRPEIEVVTPKPELRDIFLSGGD